VNDLRELLAAAQVLRGDMHAAGLDDTTVLDAIAEIAEAIAYSDAAFGNVPAGATCDYQRQGGIE
jgi:hypothetical protein